MSIMYPLQLYSWNVLSQNITYKVVDKTLVQSIETGVPMALWSSIKKKHLNNR